MLPIALRMLWLGLMVVVVSGRVSGQTYPNKPIRIVTASIGSNVDTAARLIAPGISELLGQPIVIVNRPANLTPELVVNSPADGYTLRIIGPVLWTGPLLQKMSYDPIRDLAPITLATSSPDILVVHPALPVKSVRELIALAKARPGELNYGAGPTGSSQHLAGELFKSLAGVNIERIAYQGTASQITPIIAGEVQLAFLSSNTVGPQLQSGKLRALAVASAQPSALAPGLPTVAASGLPGFESASASGIYAAVKTPEAIIARLNQELVRFLRTAEAKERFFAAGSETVGSSPAELLAIMKSKTILMAKLIKEAGIKTE